MAWAANGYEYTNKRLCRVKYHINVISDTITADSNIIRADADNVDASGLMI